jgi:hypothetical protein
MNDSPAREERSADRQPESEALTDAYAPSAEADDSGFRAWAPALFSGLFLVALILWGLFLDE